MSKYFVLQVPCDMGQLPSLAYLPHNEVDAVVDLHESSFTDFPVNDGLRVFEDNQYTYHIADTNNRESMIDCVENQIHRCECALDDLDNDEDRDEAFIESVQNELEEYRKILAELPTIR